MTGRRRVAVVTGAAKGIGRAIAEAFAYAGDIVVGLDIDRPGLAELEAALAGADGVFEGIEADVGDVGVIRRSLDQVVLKHGRIDILVNNAGITRRADLLDLTEDDWDRIIRVNAKGLFFCLQHAARQMMAQGDGRIINMASIAGKGFHAASNAIYAGSKGAVIAMTRLAAHRLGPHGITVNAVCPGITETEIYRGIIERDAAAEGVPVETIRERALAAVPIRRANTTAEVAAMVVYLASPAARNITGQSFNIDGGLVMD